MFGETLQTKKILLNGPNEERRETMKILLKKLSGKLSAGSWFSGHPEIRTVEIISDLPDIEKLIQLEEWPLVREDLEISHCQPGAVFSVAIKDGAFAGFFATHSFGRVGYLNLVIIASEFRRKGIARPLYFKTLRSHDTNGVHGYVVHTTKDSARIIQLLGFKPGSEFALLVRPAANVNAGTFQELDYRDRDALVALDAEVFGLARPEWIDALIAQRRVRFVGLRSHGTLRASVCLRPRRDAALCLDSVNSRDLADLETFVQNIVRANGATRLECIARVDSPLHHQLLEQGFQVPEFFKAIGPLVEWRKGETDGLGVSDRVQTLNWF